MAMTISTYSGKRFTASASTLPPARNAQLVTGSLPGARPMPRSIRPGWAASSSANCSATTSGAWFGSMTPPEPTRIRSVAPAITAMRTAGLVAATDGMLWCSATQYRWYPVRSATWANDTDAPDRLRRGLPRADGNEVEDGQSDLVGAHGGDNPWWGGEIPALRCGRAHHRAHPLRHAGRRCRPAHPRPGRQGDRLDHGVRRRARRVVRRWPAPQPAAGRRHRAAAQRRHRFGRGRRARHPRLALVARPGHDPLTVRSAAPGRPQPEPGLAQFRRLRGEHLVELDPVALERQPRPGEVQTPDPRHVETGLGHRGVPVRRQVVAPVPGRHRVVLAQVLVVAHLEALVLHGRDDVARAGEATVREHVAVDEPSRRDARVLVVGAGDAVVQQPTAYQQLVP